MMFWKLFGHMAIRQFCEVNIFSDFNAKYLIWLLELGGISSWKYKKVPEAGAKSFHLLLMLQAGTKM